MEKICLSPSCVLLFINLVLFLMIGFICLGISRHKTNPDETDSTLGAILKDRLKSLLAVKSIVTLTLTEVFAYLIIAEKDVQDFLTIYTVIIAFYFGTQVQKNQDSAKSVKEQAPEESDAQNKR